MNYDLRDREHPRSQDIMLTEENSKLMLELLSGLEQAITGDEAITVEISDTRNESGWFKLPQAKYLSRVAFLSINGLPASGHEDVVAAPYLLAIELSGHLLDENGAETKKPEEIDEVGFDWPDGLSMTLLTPVFSNVETWSWTFQPRGNYGFDFTGRKSGYKLSNTPSTDTIGTAYSLERGINSDVGITEDNLDRLAPFRIINTILKHGKTDVSTTEAFMGDIAKNGNIKVVPSNTNAAEKSVPYFNRILEGVLNSPHFRDMLAWQQYWLGRDQMAGYNHSRGDIVPAPEELTETQRNLSDYLLSRVLEAYLNSNTDYFNYASSAYDELVGKKPKY